MDKQKLADDAMCIHYKSHNIDLAEKVVFQHAFKNANGQRFSIFCGRLFHNLDLGPKK